MGVDVLIERCAGLDVHRDSVVASVRVPGKRRGTRRGETRTFARTIAGLERMADWLPSEHAVTLVGMESTGVYWKPVFAVLEPRVECWLLNAQHLHNVAGRKTDVADSVWIAQLIEHGLVRPSFVPPAPMRDSRDVTRLRTAITQERTRAIQRLEKVMQDHPEPIARAFEPAPNPMRGSRSSRPWRAGGAAQRRAMTPIIR
jgi:transposase